MTITSKSSVTDSRGVVMAEQMYTLAEAEAILARRMREKMCMDGPGAPGHMVQEYLTRGPAEEILVWGLGCNRCGAKFLPSWPE